MNGTGFLFGLDDLLLTTYTVPSCNTARHEDTMNDPIDRTIPLPLPDVAPWEVDQGFAPEKTSQTGDGFKKEIKACRSGLSVEQTEAIAQELRLLDARRKELENQILGEIEASKPLSLQLPSPQALVEWLKPVRKEAQEEKGAARRIRMWLNWVPESGEVLLRRDPLLMALRVSALIGPNTSLPPVASSLLESLERDARDMIRRYGFKGLQTKLMRRSVAPKLGRMPSQCTKAIPSLEEVADMVSRFRRDKLNLSEPLEEGKYAAILHKEERDKRFVQGVTVYGLYRPETGQLRLATSLMLEKFRSHAQSLGHWPFLVCQATWRKYQNARQVAGFLRRDLCRAYQAYIDLCKKERAEAESVEIDGLRVPSIPVTEQPSPGRGKAAFDGKVYKTTEEQQHYDSSKTNWEGVVKPSIRTDQRRRIKP